MTLIFDQYISLHCYYRSIFVVIHLEQNLFIVYKLLKIWFDLLLILNVFSNNLMVWLVSISLYIFGCFFHIVRVREYIYSTTLNGWKRERGVWLYEMYEKRLILFNATTTILIPLAIWYSKPLVSLVQNRSRIWVSVERESTFEVYRTYTHRIARYYIILKQIKRWWKKKKE